MKHAGKTLLLTTALAFFTVGANAEGYTNQTEQNSSSSSYNMQDGNASLDAPKVNTNSPGATATDTRMKAPDDQSAEAGSGQPQDEATASTATHARVSGNGAVNLSKSEVEDVQESLRDEGIAVSVDGMWGPRTMAALEEFQQMKNLDVTGQLDSQTIAALDVNIDDNYIP